MKNFFFPILILFFVVACNNNTGPKTVAEAYDEDVLKSVIANNDSLNTFDFVTARVQAIKTALQQPVPVLVCSDSLSANQKLAQEIALTDSTFKAFLFDIYAKQPYRNEIFGVYPARESDLANVKVACNLPTTFRVEMYNYALNSTSVAIVDVQQKKTIHRFYLRQMQPDISKTLKDLAVKIALESPEVQQALGFKPPKKML